MERSNSRSSSKGSSVPRSSSTKRTSSSSSAKKGSTKEPKEAKKKEPEPEPEPAPPTIEIVEQKPEPIKPTTSSSASVSTMEIEKPENNESQIDADTDSTDGKSFMERAIARVKQIKPLYWGFYALILIMGTLIALYIEFENKQREWHLLNVYGVICLILAVGDGTPREFFRPVDESNTDDRKCFAFWLLTMTSFVSWVMAKSIQNSSKLGSRYGLVGGLAYASWFIGVFTTGVIVYFLRKQGYYSLPDFINDRYGPLACVVFALTVMYRLFNEVWSNTIVIADFFGSSLSHDWKLAAWIAMAIPASYTFIGGMRASLYSDAIQALLMCVLLIMTYMQLTNAISGNDELKEYLKANKNSDNLWYYNPDQTRERFSLEGGLDLLYTGLVQGALSYTFMDPALTDRAFLASKEVMIFAFGLGSLLAMAYITVFGFIGVYGNMLGECVEAGACKNSHLRGADVGDVSGGEPSAVGQSLGGTYYTLLLLVIITSALSTLDSTFSAVAKVAGPDLHGFLTNGRPINPSLATDRDVLIGRIAIVIIGITGTLPLMDNPDELDATTVTGTMVPGLGPPIYMAAFGCLLGAKYSGRATLKTRPMLFLLPFFFSAALGTVYQMSTQDENCSPFKVMNCQVPVWSNKTTDACEDYSTYFQCRFDAGCWRNEDTNECNSIEAKLSTWHNNVCSLPCKDERSNRKQRFHTVVDLNGFNVGGGAYKNLLGVNLVSAAGALFLFLLACSDDFLAEKFDEIKANTAEADEGEQKDDTTKVATSEQTDLGTKF